MQQLHNEKEADSVSNTEAYNLLTSTPLEQIKFHSKIDIEVLQFLEDKSKDLLCFMFYVLFEPISSRKTVVFEI